MKMFWIAWSRFFSSVRPACRSVARQHLCGLTDVIRGNQMQLDTDSSLA